MWSHFEGVARTREQTLKRINELHWTGWKPQGITLHNTAAPTLAQWAESGPNHDARIRNLQNYYEKQLGWHAGPHFFISRNWINWFSNPLSQGVHSRCWNATRFGIEQVGDFNREEYNSGDGMLVRDNAIFLCAALNLKFGFKASDVVFHVECKRDNHDCPGKKARNKPDLIARINACMQVIKAGGLVDVSKPAPTPAPTPAPASPGRQMHIKMTEFAGPSDGVGDRTNGYTSKLIDWKLPGVALPYHFRGVLPKIRVFWNNKSVVADLVDIGPWHSLVGDDLYWLKGNRPRAEDMHAKGHGTNGAGIDGTPGLFDALDISGPREQRSALIDWEFVSP